MKEILKRTFVRDEAYSLLREWIVRGKLAPSQKLRDKDLAAELGVSRTPIREALLRLEEEGLVQTKPNSSTIVTPLEFHQAENLYSIVWTLEGLALRQAFKFIDKAHVDKMRKANESMLKALEKQNPLLAIEADTDFHNTYLLLSQNRDLYQMILTAKQKINRLKIFYFLEIQDRMASYEEHLLIIEAIQNRNPDAALQALQSNWQNSCSRIQRTHDEKLTLN